MHIHMPADTQEHTHTRAMNKLRFLSDTEQAVSQFLHIRGQWGGCTVLSIARVQPEFVFH